MSLRGVAGAWLVPCVPSAPPIERGAVVFDAGQRVVRVGPDAVLQREFPGVVFSRERAVLMPGLVNAHTHLELSALRGLTRGGAGFGPWAESMMAARAREAPEQDADAIDGAVSMLLRSGTVAIGEVTNTLASVPSLGTAPLLGRVFHEVFGVTRAAAEAGRERARATRAAMEPWPTNLSYAPAPHTLYSLHPDVAQALVAEARGLGERTSLHLAEHAAERAFLRDGTGPFVDFLRARGAGQPDFPPPGLAPVDYAAALGLLTPDVLAVHLTATTPEELARVAAAGVFAVLCPRSNLFIELKLPPLYAILAAGLQPGLGSDSLASNTTLDVLAEAEALHARFPGVPALTLLEMATCHGASALGLGHRVGSLREGLSPGLLAIDLEETPPGFDPAAHALSAPLGARRVLFRPALPTAERPLGVAP